VPFPPPVDNSGKCLVPNDVTPGGPCSGEADVCAAGYYCDPRAKQCVADAQLGTPCQSDYQPCAPGLVCTNGLFAACKANGADGDPCAAATDCSSGLCDKPANQAAGNCTAVIVLSSVDSMCALYR
jgi:hypothetical protein